MSGGIRPRVQRMCILNLLFEIETTLVNQTQIEGRAIAYAHRTCMCGMKSAHLTMVIQLNCVSMELKVDWKVYAFMQKCVQIMPESSGAHH